jgi:EAL domain-containing protein (putative c-di-GMP-specific phosphodiesterase class I)
MATQVMLHGPAAVCGAAVVLGLTVCAVLSAELAPVHTAVRHLFYLPVMLASVRFRYTGAISSALFAGLGAGPLVTVIGHNDGQGPVDWIIRAVLFAIVGASITFLVERSTLSLRQELEELRLVSDLRTALAQGQLGVHYQPIVSLEDYRVIGVEALVRWRHPRRGPIPPDVFIPAAERSGLVGELGEWVLREACREVVRWRDSELLPDVRFRLGVNLSAAQLADEYLVPRVASILRWSGLDPSWLAMEVTETALIGDLKGSAQRLDGLRALGISIAVDDYGTGYGSLSYARHLPTDTLKIDASFVRGLGSDHRDAAIVNSVVTLAKLLNQTTVAEGVETLQQAEVLRELGCDQAQGFLFARPMHASSVAKLLRRRLDPGDLPTTSAAVYGAA